MLCVPNRDERLDFDAEVRDPSPSLRVEMTLARDPNWHHCMAYLLEHGHVNMWGPVAVDALVLRKFHLRLVKAAAERKAGRGRYGHGYELVITVEDSWFRCRPRRHSGRRLSGTQDCDTSALLRRRACVGWTDDLYKSVLIRC